MRILVLDDDPKRHSAFRAALEVAAIHVHNYKQACDALQGERFDLVYLDRDLNDFGVHDKSGGGCGQHELTGEDVATFITTLPEEQRPVRVIVHSWNPDGARRMVETLKAASIPVRYEPFRNPICLKCRKPLADHDGDNRTTKVCP